MVQLEVTVTGSFLGYALAHDAEECAYALEAMADAASPDFPREVAEMLPPACAGSVIAMLRLIIEQIEGEAL